MEDLILKLKRQNITLNVVDDQLNLEVPETFQEEQLLEEVREHKQELIQYIKNIQGNSRFPELSVAKDKDYYALSSAQKRMYFLYEFDKKSTAYNLPQFVKLTGKLHQKKLENAFHKLIERHEILRTSFLIIDGETFQKVEKEFDFLLEVFTATTAADIDAIINQFIRPFNLAKAPLLRAGLISINEEEHVLMLDMHHIASDGYSQGLLIDDFMNIYDEQELKPVIWQYKDYAEWQQSKAVQTKINANKTFWLNQFEEDAIPLNLPMDYARSAIRKDDGDTVHFEITEAETITLNKIAKEEGTTIFMVVLALYNVLLSKLSGETDISIGTSVAGREQAGLDTIVGMFVNTLVLRNFPTSESKFDSFLATLKENTVQCFEHQEYQFEQLIEELQVVRDNSRNALFDAHFTFQNFEEAELAIPELVLTSYHRNTKVSKFDLELGAMEVEGKLKFYFEYASALFKEETMQRFIDYFKKIIAAVVHNKSIPIREIEILSNDEYNLLEAVNKTDFQPETAHTIVSLFEHQVEKTPNSIAVKYGTQQLTYAELNARSNQLARYLRANYNVGRDKIISILMEKSADYLVSILGVLKSGSCYLPIDGNYPSSRKIYMVEDSGSVLLLSKGLNGEGLLYENVPVVDISLAELDRYSHENLNLTIQEDDLAYVIYTSGSTGVPKGVMIEHSGNVNMSSDQVRRYNVNEKDVVVWFASVGFDASVFEIMMAMYSGATLAIPESGVIKNKDHFVEFLENSKASIVTFPPSYVSLLSIEELKGLRLVITAGEAAQGSKAYEITASGKEYYNAYGPTECSVCVSVYKYDRQNGILQNVPIGTPIANTRLYVLNEDLQKVATGVWGELCVSGVGLSRGYIGKESLTEEKFIENPYEVGKKMYRTGDICRWNTNGELEFKGRKDTQVKLRGYRIELGEIESVVSLQEGISQSVVVIHGEGEAQDLGCYVVMDKNSSLDAEKLKTALMGLLPEYMVPTHYMELEELPLTINGKIDKKQLPEIVVTSEDYQAPTTDTEHKLVALWSEVLEIKEETISTTKSFFELGGNSLTAISLINKLQEKLGIKIALDEFFSQPTIQGIINLLPTATHQEYQKIEPVAPAKYYQLSSAQKRMYFLYELDKNSIAYNAPYFVILSGTLDAKHLENSFKKLVERHESLRTSFKIIDDAPLQYIIPITELNFAIETYELTSGKDEKECMQEFIRPFNLEKAPLFRVGLIQLESNKHVLMLDMHHIISDGYSQGILINDFAKIYQGETLQPLKIQYKDYANWQQSDDHYQDMLQHREYWMNKFEEAPVELQLPYDFMRPASIGEEGNIFEFELSSQETESLKKIADAHGATLFMIVLAAYNILLSKLSGETDITVGTSVSGREHNDLETMVGMFVNTLVLRNYPSFNKKIETFLQELKQNTIQSFEHQDYQYEELIEDLKLTGNTSNNPLFDAHFTFQNFKDATFTIPGLELQTYEFDVTVTKFDIELSVMEFENKLQLTFEYATSLFTKETMQRFSNYFKKIVKHIIQDTSDQISDINIFGNEEIEFLNTINTTDVSYPLHKTLVDLFEEQVLKTPENIAITFGSEQLTYQELNRRSNQLANYLKKEQGIDVEDIVGILLPKSSDFIVSILAILKCGAAYLPLDAKLPTARIAQMTDVERLKTTIASRELQQDKSLEKALIFDDLNLENQEENNLQVGMNANTLAYIIYTSGSTGAPKGVMIEHKGIVNTALDHINIYDITEDDTLTWFAAVGFDVSVFEITMSLLSGATLAIPVEGAIEDQVKYVRFIADANVTFPTIPPTYLDLMSLEDIKGIRGVITGGEAGNINKANEVVAAGIRYFNSYGMTECAVCVSYFELKKEDNNLTRIPIGVPTANTRLYVLNDNLEKVATGVWGELCVSGVGLSRGYIGKESLTAEKFIANPYEAGQKMYRTGDICRWNTSGELEFKGRKDTQVKLRGYRIELGEIESVVSLQEDISQSVVVLYGEGEVQDLACYVVLDKNTSLDIAKLKASLTEALPEYMVPTHYMELEELPLTINGKVDKKRLPAIEIGSSEGDSDFTAQELLIRSIWSGILEIDEARIFKGDNFFDLGGNSLSAISLINKLSKDLEVKVPLDEVFSTPTLAGLSAFIESSVKSSHSSIPILGEKEFYALSSAQRRMYFLYEFNRDSITYNMPNIVILRGELNVTRFENTIKALIARHESLRTYFEMQGDEVYQKILPKELVDFSVAHYQGDALESEKVHAIIEDFIRPFDLSQAPLLRVGLIQITAEEHILMLDMHHIITDGVSQGILVRDFMELYKDDSSLKELDVRYVDYSDWQQKEGIVAKSKDYWMNVYHQIPEVLDIPTDYLRGSVRDEGGSSVVFELDNKQVAGLKKLSESYGITLYMLLLGIYKIVLSKLSGQEDIVVGTPVAGRGHSDVEGIVGLFVNTLALRTNVSSSKSFKSYIKDLGEDVINSFEHQDFQYEELVNLLEIERDTSRNALFDVMFSYESMGDRSVEIPGLVLEPYERNTTISKFDLDLSVFEDGEGNLQLSFEYATSLYNRSTIERYSNYYLQILTTILANPSQKIAELEILSTQERELLMSFSTGAKIDYGNATVLDIFKDTAEKKGDGIALRYEGATMSYKELDRRSNDLAGYLIHNNILGEDKLVPISLDRGFMMVVGILGILKSGGGYVPIDPLYPASRKHYILKDIAAKTIITTSDYREEYSDLGYDVLNLDAKETYQTNDKITLATVTPEDTIYVLYTSGSTGVPKGVINTHKGLYNRLLWMRDSLCLDENDVVLQKTTFCFDVSFWELMLPIIIGGEMVLARAGGEKDSEYLSKIIEEEGITLLHFVPSMLAAFLSDVNSSFKNLRSVVCSGEALPKSVVSSFASKMGATELYNLYGPTEAAIDVTAINLSDYKGSGIPIGKPVNNTDIYIVNDTNELQPIGVKGELCIGGVQVSKGYLHNEELTAEKYINNPYGEGRLYRTGDLARWDAEGNIEYLGREDSQIKLRGYRIELGEITRVVENYPNIAQAVVIKGEIGTSEHLLCYYRSDSETIDENKLKAHLSGQLPNYMVPSYYKQLEHFALTSNGKLDRKQLPEITITSQEGTQQAQTKDEKAMVAIWEGLLGISPIGINTNFFELGGDSIKAIQLMSRSKQQGYHFKVKDVFKHPTIAGLLSVCGESETLLIETGVLEGDFELLPIQYRFMEHNHKVPNHYNQSVLLSIPKDFSNDILKSSIKKLVEHHDILRSSYKDGKGYYHQEITDYYKEETASDDNQLTKCCQGYQESFDIANEPLIRFIKINYPSDTKDRLFIVAHHLVIDGVSWRIILEDLEHLLSNRNYTLPEKQSSLRQWSKGLSDYTVSLSEGVKEYWQGISKDYKLLKDLNNNPLSGKLETHSEILDKEITKSLSQEIHGKYGTELQDVLLSCLSQVLGSHYQRSDVYIDLEGHGREEIISGLDISRTIGWFTSLYPLKLQVSETIGVQLRDTKDMLKEVPDGGLSYGALRYLSDNTQKYEYNKGGILFNYLGDFSSTVAEEGLLGFAGESTGDNIHPSNSEGYGLLLTFMIAGGELQMNWSYDEGMYSKSEIATLSEKYQSALKAVIDHCKESTARILSCSDCGLPSSVGNIALDEFIKTCETKYGAIESVYRLSPLQEGMLFHSLYGGEGSGSYVSEFVCDFNGGINYEVFKSVWESIVARHGILRTGIYSEGLSHAVQCVYKSVDLPITHYNYTDKDEKWLSNYFEDKALVSFDMESAPLFSFELYDLPGGITRLYLYNHHILWDGWSLSILMNEFIQGYDTAFDGATIEQGYVSDYGAYVRDLYDRDRSGEGISYWQEYLSGVEGGVYLPFLKDTSLRNNVFGDSHVSFELDSNHTNLLVKYSQTHGLTMNTLVQGAWSYLLHSYTGAEKIVFGATVSGRDWSVGSVEQEVGLYINTLPVSIEVDRDQDLGDWLSDLQAGHSKGREQYSHVSLSMIQEAMGVNEALFDSLIVFENYPVDEELLSTSSLNMVDMYSNEYTNYALTIGVSHTGDRLHFKLDYNKEVFPQAYIDLIVAHLQNVLHSIGKATEKVGALSYIDESENVLQLGKGNTIAIEDATTIVSLFEDQVKKVPDNIASIYNGQAVTYAALNARSNRLARYLQANHNVGKDTVVAIQMEKSLDYLTTILGVLKSGSCYLPIDIDHPATRKDYMLRDSNAVLILSTTAHTTDTSLSEIPVVTIDTISLDTYPKENLDITIASNDLAYMIYTSGSTGVPKGVMIEHSGNVNMSLDQVRIFGVTATDVVVWFASVGFDASVSEIMMALYSGATLAIPGSGVIKDKDRFVNFLQKTKASVVTFPPSYVSLLSLEEIEGIRVVITAGEAAQGSKAYEIAASGKEYYNAYGPTECSVCVSVYKYDYQEGIVQNVPIGSAIANTRLYVLNEDLQKVATGVWGELCVSGVGVSRGYIGKESLTAEKFITNPYEAGQKMYRTGDVCRWNTSGELEFKGRKDTQVKLRGYRIELGEIESIVNLQEGINQSIVIIHGEGEVQDLACYVVLDKNTSLDIEKLKASLTEALPEYMVPTHYMELEELPLTINGKVDKKRLPAIEMGSSEGESDFTEQELLIRSIWSDVLEIDEDRIFKGDSFFDLGGNSLSAISLVNKLAKDLEVKVPLDEVFSIPTLEGLSSYIEKSTKSSHSSIPVLEKMEHYGLSSAQRRMYFLYEFNRESITYNMPNIVILRGELDATRFENTIKALITRHESLRTYFEMQDDEVYQKILPKASVNFSVDHYQGDALKSEKVDTLIEDFIRPFDLSQGPLLRVGLIQITAEEHILMLDMHHIITDGVSQGILVSDFMELYKDDSSLKELDVRYVDYSDWQQKEGIVAKSKDYWMNVYHEIPEVLDIPTDYPRGSVRDEGGSSVIFELEQNQVVGLKKLSEAYGITQYMLLLGIYKILLSKLSGQEDVVVGTPVAGRGHSDVEGIVGLFVNTLALRTNVSSNKSFKSYIKDLGEDVINSFEHQDFQYEELVNLLEIERDTSRNALFDVMFSYESMGDRGLEIPGLVLEPYDRSTNISKFDLELSAIESEGRIMLNIMYATRLFTSSTINRIAKYYVRMLDQIVSDSGILVKDIRLLDASERKALLPTSEAFSLEEEVSLALYLEEIFNRYNDKEALRDADGRSMNYEELWRKSGKVSNYLAAKYGLKQGDTVVLYSDRSMEMVVLFFSLTRLGCVYVPVDTIHPEERLRYITKDSSSRLLIVEDDTNIKIENTQTVGLSEVLEASSKVEENLITEKPIPLDATLYIIYTSGSTGMPKGVCVSQGNLLGYLKGIEEEFGNSRTQPVLSSHGFDIFFFELLSPLLKGGTSILLRNEEVRDMDTLEFALQKSTSFHAVPALMRAVLDHIEQTNTKEAFTKIEELYVGGDVVSGALLRKMQSVFPQARIYVFYGPTEGTIFVTSKLYEPNSNVGDSLALGKNLRSSQVLVLDRYNNLVAPGVKGELCIGGVQVSKGYLHNEELTAEKYINNPYGEGRLYRTGDLARWDAEGNIEYLGREDSQIKLRGYRIELGEITRVVENYPNIAQAVVIKGEIGTSEHLLCYYRSDSETIDENKLKAHLSGQLPNYMVPSYYKQLEHFALTSNGKLDRKQLPEISITSQEGHQVARTKEEQAMVAIWEGLLGISPIGIHTNFFELGGDSIKAIQLMSRSKQQGYHFKVKDVFKHPTIAGLLSVCGESEQLLVETGLLEGDFELLPIQHRFIEHNHKVPNHYNQSVLLSIPKDFSNDILKSSIKKLIAHHDILRSSYKEGQGFYHQEITEYYKEETASDENTLTGFCQEYQESFDIANGPLIRFIKINYPSDTKDRLFIVAHHLVIDGVSWRIILEDLEHLLSNQNYTLPEKQSSLRQWSKGLAEYTSSLSEGVKEYWQEISKDYKLLKDLNNSPLSGKLETHSEILDKEITKSLSQEIHGKYGTELQDVLLSCLSQVLGNHYNTSQIYIDLEGHGREEIISELDISRTIGWFTSLYPLKLQVSQAVGIQLRDTKDMLKEVPDGGLSYGALRYLSDNPQKYEYSKGGILFNYLGDFSSTVAEEGLLGFAGESTGDNIHPSNSEGYGLLLTFMIAGGELQMNWSYDEGMYRESEIATLSALYQNALIEVIADCKDTTARILSCSDCGLPSSVGNIALDEFIKTCETKYGAIESVYRLSPLQEGMLFHSLYGGEGSGSYVSEFVCDFNGGINYDVFKSVWESIIARHGILRTGIYSEGLSHAVQCVYKSVDLPITHYNYTDKDEKWLSNYFTDKKLVSFDMESAPLFSFELYDLPGGITRLYLYNHHILWDGWSLSILMNEFIQGYDTALEGTTIEQGYVSDYGAYVRDLYDRDRSGEGVNYWQEYLSGVEGGVYLPFLKDTSLRNSVFGDSHVSFELDSNHTNLLVKYSQTHGLTMNTLVQGAWSYLLHSYTGAEKIVFGATVSGRDWSVGSVEQEVGLYINTLPVSIEVDRDQDLGDWLSDLQAGHSKGREQYSHVSLSMIQEAMGVNEALFDSLIVFENHPMDEDTFNTSSLQAVNFQTKEYTNYALTIAVSHTGNRLHFKLDYNKEAFPQEYIDMIVMHLNNVLQSMSLGADTVGAMEHITEEDRKALLPTSELFSLEAAASLELYLEEIFIQYKDIAALRAVDGQSMSYDELWSQSGKVSNYLAARYGLGLGDVVVLYSDRSMDMVVLFLALLRLGCVYVPVDKIHPENRLRYIVKDSGSDLLIVEGTTNIKIENTQIVGLSEVLEASSKVEENLIIEKSIPLDATLYIIYTSGSTGMPKGVCVSHGNLLGYLKGIEDEFGKNRIQPVLSSHGFDIFFFELLSPLLKGGTSILLRNEEVRDMEVLEKALKQSTSFHGVPALMRAVLDHIEVGNNSTLYTKIEELYVGGDVVSGALLRKMQSVFPQARIYVFYGPTEGTIFVTSKLYAPSSKISESLALGKSLRSSQVLVLDRYNNLVAPGVKGELCIGGVQVSKGYLHNEELTAKKYINNPYGEGRLYRTGDLARWDAEGNIEYLGREDSQIKLRGYRIELGEINRKLEMHTDIIEAVVLVVTINDIERLIAFVRTSTSEAISTEEFVNHLRLSLPDYMIPRHYVSLENFPLTSNNKVDKNALKEMEFENMNNYEPPTNKVEEKLISFWSELLKIDEDLIGVTENFFMLGGDSIKVITLQNKIKQEFDVKIKLETFFEVPVIRELAKVILVAEFTSGREEDSQGEAKITI